MADLTILHRTFKHPAIEATLEGEKAKILFTRSTNSESMEIIKSTPDKEADWTTLDKEQTLELARFLLSEALEMK